MVSRSRAGSQLNQDGRSSIWQSGFARVASSMINHGHARYDRLTNCRRLRLGGGAIALSAKHVGISASRTRDHLTLDLPSSSDLFCSVP